MSVYDHPYKPGWQMIKIFRGKEKPEYITFHGSRDAALIYEKELRGIADRSDPEFTDRQPEFNIAYKNEVSAGTYSDYEWAWKQLEPFFKTMKIRHITPSVIEQYKNHRLGCVVKTTGKTISKRTINRELTYLSKYLAYCGSDLKPAKFRKRDTAPPLPDVLTLGELENLISKLTPPVKHLVQLMTYNGLRKTEAMTLKASAAEKDGSQIRILGKGNKWRLAPIELPELQKAIASAKKNNPEGYLFPNPATSEPYQDIRRHLKNAAAAAGITKPVYNHLLRHSFGTALVKEGVNLRIVQGLLGHADLKTVQIYTHLADDTLRSGTAALIRKPATDAVPKSTKKQNVKRNNKKLGV